MLYKNGKVATVYLKSNMGTNGDQFVINFKTTAGNDLSLRSPYSAVIIRTKVHLLLDRPDSLNLRCTTKSTPRCNFLRQQTVVPTLKVVIVCRYHFSLAFTVA